MNKRDVRRSVIACANAALWPCVGAVLLSAALGAEAADPRYEVRIKQCKRETPTAAIMAAAAYDGKRDALLVFGGMDPDQPDAHPALWRLDLESEQWKILEVAGRTPMAVIGPTLVYDSKRDALFLHGGWARRAEAPSARFWMLSFGDADRPTCRALADDGARPRARNGAVMVLDADRDRLLLHGGDGGPHPQYGFTPLDDLWAYDLGTKRWTCLEPQGDVPPPRWNHCAAIDRQGKRMFLFGGAGYTDETLVLENCMYELDLERLVWSRHTQGGECPVPVQGATLTYDAGAGVLVLLGGLSMADSGPAGDTSVWLFDPGKRSWTKQAGLLRNTRRSHTAVYSSRRKTHIIVGGEAPKVRQNYYEHGRPLRDTLLLEVRQK